MNYKEIAHNIRSAMAVIATPEAWVQGRAATDANGIFICPEDDDAICFCAIGAVFKVVGDYPVNNTTARFLHAYAQSALSTCDFAEYNDNHTHTEVLAALEAAAKQAEALAVVDMLEAAAELLADPAKWAKGATAYDAFGIPVLPKSGSAVCFCALGAIISVEDKCDYPLRAVSRLRGSLGSVVFLNDAETTTHADVLAMFAEMIQQAKDAVPN